MVHAEIQWTTINVMGPNPFSLKCLKYATDSTLKLITRFITHSPMSQRSPKLYIWYCFDANVNNNYSYLWKCSIIHYYTFQRYIVQNKMKVRIVPSYILTISRYEKHFLLHVGFLSFENFKLFSVRCWPISMSIHIHKHFLSYWVTKMLNFRNWRK